MSHNERASIDAAIQFEGMIGQPFDYTAFRRVYDAYHQPHRFFHTWEHVESIWKIIQSLNLPNADRFYVAALYHDVVYIPGATDNEERSVHELLFHHNLNRDGKMEFLEGSASERLQGVVSMIRATRDHVEKTGNDDNDLFVRMDMASLIHDLDVPGSELKIFKEFQKYSVEQWRQGRLKFLGECNYRDHPVVKQRTEFVKNFRPKVGLFCGTFNKFHIGHLNVLEKAEKVFDKVIVVQAVNPAKENPASLYQVQDVLPFHEVLKHKGFLTKLVTDIEAMRADVSIVKGFRNGQDIPYEMQLLRFMQDQVPGVSVIYIPCDAAYEHISSSMLNGITTFGGSDAAYLPTKYDYARSPS